MSPIQWNTENNVGNALIDKQHKEWVRIFNHLEKSLSSSDGPPSNSQLDLLKEILEFIRSHFLEEEQLMKLHDYPDLVKHRRMHKEFELQMYEKFRMVMAGECVLKSEIMALIRHWFITHTGSEDVKTFQYINSKNTVA